VVTALATSRAYDFGQRAERQERVTHRPVVATVVAGDSVTGGSAQGTGPTVRLSWRAHDGTARFAVVPERETDRVGSQHRIWIDETGNLTRKPRDHGQTFVDTVLAGTASVAAVVLPCVVLYVAVQRRLDRRRDDQWTADWARTAPIWTRRTG
jgi:hypothetical protein